MPGSEYRNSQDRFQLPVATEADFDECLEVREDIGRKKTFSFGHCPNEGGGGLPMPEFFGPLFLPSNSP